MQQLWTYMNLVYSHLKADYSFAALVLVHDATLSWSYMNQSKTTTNALPITFYMQYEMQMQYIYSIMLSYGHTLIVTIFFKHFFNFPTCTFDMQPFYTIIDTLRNTFHVDNHLWITQLHVQFRDTISVHNFSFLESGSFWLPTFGVHNS